MCLAATVWNEKKKQPLGSEMLALSSLQSMPNPDCVLMRLSRIVVGCSITEGYITPGKRLVGVSGDKAGTGFK